MDMQIKNNLLDAFLAEFDSALEVQIYRDIALFLSGLGYNPKKDRSNISFKHTLHNKQIAKMGMKASKKNAPAPFFSLRFSACRGYSQRFADIIHENIAKYPAKVPRCTDGGCDFCKGSADSHIYSYTLADGEVKTHCGAYAMEILHISKEDIPELKKLIQEEHDYLMKHEAMPNSLTL